VALAVSTFAVLVLINVVRHECRRRAAKQAREASAFSEMRPGEAKPAVERPTVRIAQGPAHAAGVAAPGPGVRAAAVSAGGGASGARGGVARHATSATVALPLGTAAAARRADGEGPSDANSRSAAGAESLRGHSVQAAAPTKPGATVASLRQRSVRRARSEQGAAAGHKGAADGMASPPATFDPSGRGLALFGFGGHGRPSSRAGRSARRRPHTLHAEQSSAYWASTRQNHRASPSFAVLGAPATTLVADDTAEAGFVGGNVSHALGAMLGAAAASPPRDSDSPAPSGFHARKATTVEAARWWRSVFAPEAAVSLSLRAVDIAVSGFNPTAGSHPHDHMPAALRPAMPDDQHPGRAGPQAPNRGNAVGGAAAAVVSGITASLPAGTTTAILGPSACGKSTLLKTIMMRNPSADVVGGDVVARVPSQRPGGKASSIRLDSIPGRLGFCPQSDDVHDDLTPRQILTFHARVRGGLGDDEAAHIVDDVLAAVGLEHAADRRVKQPSHAGGGLSGGEQRRLSVACELVTKPILLAADEVTSGLDASAAVSVALLLRRIARTGLLVASVIHQPRAEVLATFDRIILLTPYGQAAYVGPRVLLRPYLAGCLGVELHPACNIADAALDVVSGVAVHSPAAARALPVWSGTALAHNGARRRAMDSLVAAGGARPASLRWDGDARTLGAYFNAAGSRWALLQQAKRSVHDVMALMRMSAAVLTVCDGRAAAPAAAADERLSEVCDGAVAALAGARRPQADGGALDPLGELESEEGSDRDGVTPAAASASVSGRTQPDSTSGGRSDGRASTQESSASLRTPGPAAAGPVASPPPPAAGSAAMVSDAAAAPPRPPLLGKPGLQPGMPALGGGRAAAEPALARIGVVWVWVRELGPQRLPKQIMESAMAQSAAMADGTDEAELRPIARRAAEASTIDEASWMRQPVTLRLLGAALDARGRRLAAEREQSRGRDGRAEPEDPAHRSGPGVTVDDGPGWRPHRAGGATWPLQLWSMLARDARLLYLTRPQRLVASVALVAMFGVLPGFLYDSATQIDSAQWMWLVPMAAGFFAITQALPLLRDEDSVVRREADSGTSQSAYAVAKILAPLPLVAVQALVLAASSMVFADTQELRLDHVFMTTLLTMVQATATGALVAVMVPGNVAQLASVLLALCFPLVAGLRPNLDAIDEMGTFFVAVSRLSWSYYAFAHSWCVDTGLNYLVSIRPGQLVQAVYGHNCPAIREDPWGSLLWAQAVVILAVYSLFVLVLAARTRAGARTPCCR